MQKRILVTGGIGFIGSHLVDGLVSAGHDVRVFDNLEPQVHQGMKPDYLNPKAEYVKGDMRNPEDIEKALRDIEVVFHKAAMVGVGQSMYQISRYMDVNTMGTSRLLDIIANKENQVRKIVVASSMSVYGEGSYECGDCGVVYPRLRPEEQLKSHNWEMKCPVCGKVVSPLPTAEDKPLMPTSIYAISKRDQEEMCLAVGEAYGIPAVALRYFNVYGSRQSLNNPYTGLCAIISSRVKNNNPPMIFEDGEQSRDFVHVRDIVQANLLVMDNDKAKGRVFNVGTGVPTTVNKVAETLIKLYKKGLKPEIVSKFRAGDIRHCFADISRIRELGYKPGWNFEMGMKELVSWGENARAEDKAEQALQELKDKGLIE